MPAIGSCGFYVFCERFLIGAGFDNGEVVSPHFTEGDDGLFVPKIAVVLALAIFLASWLGLMTNIVMKVSLHAISMGVMLAFIFLLAYSDSLSYGPYITIALLFAGLVCTSRFIASDHTAKEVYGGLAVGIASMLIANLFV